MYRLVEWYLFRTSRMADVHYAPTKFPPFVPALSAAAGPDVRGTSHDFVYVA